MDSGHGTRVLFPSSVEGFHYYSRQIETLFLKFKFITQLKVNFESKENNFILCPFKIAQIRQLKQMRCSKLSLVHGTLPYTKILKLIY